MTPAPATIPIRPRWTIKGDGKPTAEAIHSLARLCVSVARKRLAEREQAHQDEHQDSKEAVA